MIGNDNLLIDAFIFLLVALIAVPVARRVGLGQSVGYLLAGMFIGPWGSGDYSRRRYCINSPAD